MMIIIPIYTEKCTPFSHIVQSKPCGIWCVKYCRSYSCKMYKLVFNLPFIQIACELLKAVTNSHKVIQSQGQFLVHCTLAETKIVRLVFANGQLSSTFVTITLLFTFITILLTVRLPAHLEQTKSVCAIIYLYLKKLYYA
jgi:hypothetical protein